MGLSAHAVIFAEKNKVEVGPIDLPDPLPGDLVIRTLYSGVSPGTELWSLTGKYWSTKFPTIPGYQKVGVIEQADGDCNGFRVGDTVFFRSTRVNEGTNIEWAGHTGLSVVASDEPELFKLPEGLAPDEASLLCMAAIGYHGVVDVMPVQAGEWVAVIGLGLIGQFSAQSAALQGANVIGLDLVDQRLDCAAELAGAVRINPSEQDPTEAIKAVRPEGLDAVIDTSAHAPTVNQSFHWLRDKGRYCLQGYYPELTPLDLLWPHAKELTLYNPTNCTLDNELDCAKHLASEKMKMKPLISHTVSFRDAPAIYDTLLNKREPTMGVVLDWQS